MQLMGTEVKTNPMEWCASLQHQKRSFLAIESFPGSMMHDLDNIIARDTKPTPAGLQRVLEIMVAMNLSSQDVANRAEWLRAGKLQPPQTFKTL